MITRYNKVLTFSVLSLILSVSALLVACATVPDVPVIEVAKVEGYIREVDANGDGVLSATEIGALLLKLRGR